MHFRCKSFPSSSSNLVYILKTSSPVSDLRVYADMELSGIASQFATQKVINCDSS